MTWRSLTTVLLSIILSSCSFNPFLENNHLTGDPLWTAIGAGTGGGIMAGLHAPGFVTGLSALGGGAIGYYATTLRFAAGGVIQVGGTVYKVGDFVGIYVPTDKLFDPNSAEFTWRAPAILDSVVAVLCRYPDNHILISGNTNGFASDKYERMLSEQRAKAVASYLWAHGISVFMGQSIHTRKLTYVGYGNYFPIANNITHQGIRANARIQITSYPTNLQLQLCGRAHVFRNIGAVADIP